MSMLTHRRPCLVAFLAFCAAVLLLASRAHQPQPPANGDLPSFWSGLLHGFLIFFSFVGSLFTHVRIYAFPNTGAWYDFGYLLGAAIFLGGGGASAN